MRNAPFPNQCAFGAQAVEAFVSIVLPGDQIASAIRDHCQCSEAVHFHFEDPIPMVEWNWRTSGNREPNGAKLLHGIKL
jgi:hypothetical protein